MSAEHRLSLAPLVDLGRRLTQLAVVLIFVSVLVFLVQGTAPLDRAEIVVGPRPDLTPAERLQAVAQERRFLGLDQPLPVQYWLWLNRALRFDFGTTASGRPVTNEIARRLGPTIEIAVASSLLSIPTALILALLTAPRNLRLWTRAMDVLAITGLVIPAFWLGILLVLVFAVWLKVLPASGYQPPSAGLLPHLESLTLPVITLSVPAVAIYYRYLQQGLVAALRSAYVRTARAKGLKSRSILMVHALPNAVLPALTVFGIHLAGLIGGVVIVENVFAWPGMGNLLVFAAESSDYNTVIAIVLLMATAFVVLSNLVDMTHAALDPRIRRA